MSVPTEFHSTLGKTYSTLCISVRRPITEVKAEWNAAADVWEIAKIGQKLLTWTSRFRFCLFVATVYAIYVINDKIHRQLSKHRIPYHWGPWGSTWLLLFLNTLWMGISYCIGLYFLWYLIIYFLTCYTWRQCSWLVAFHFSTAEEDIWHTLRYISFFKQRKNCFGP